MISEKMQQVMQHEGVVAIATQGEKEPHLVNTWNKYITVAADNRMLIPVGGMNTTESNIGRNNQVIITLGSREVNGFNGPGTGFLVKGTAAFIKHGPEFDKVKQKFPWARAALEVTITSVTQTL